jgi:hypothetical protein
MIFQILLLLGIGIGIFYYISMKKHYIYTISNELDIDQPRLWDFLYNIFVDSRQIEGFPHDFFPRFEDMITRIS